ncbi:MAG: hypothetical protein V3T31_05125, partial [candidate division Zixibacteria bacterium]
MTIRTKKSPKVQVRAQIVPESFDAESRTVDVIASTGAKVFRSPFFSAPFFQELEISKRAIRLQRFEGGASVLDTHGMTKGFLDGSPGVRDVMGVTMNPRIEKGNLVTSVRFSSREEFNGIVNDIQDGILRNVSIGFVIHRNKELQTDKGETKIFRAVDWEPHELSFVPIPADPGAVTRSNEQTNEFDCEFEMLNSHEDEDSNDEPEQGVSTDTTDGETRNQTGEGESMSIEEQKKLQDEAAKEAVQAERKRAADIRTAVRAAKLGDDIADSLIDSGTSMDGEGGVRSQILDQLAKKDEAPEVRTSGVNIEAGEDLSHVGMIRGMGASLSLRMNSSVKMGDEERKLAEPFKFMRLLDYSRECLEAKGVNTRGMNPMDIATRGLHSTSDFPEILANVLNKTLRRAYEESP